MDYISGSDPKPGTSQQHPDLQIPPSTWNTDKAMEIEFTGPPLSPQFIQRYESELPSEGNSEQSEAVQTVRPKKHSDKRKHKSQSKYVLS